MSYKSAAGYVLKGENEFERLEHQSSFEITSPKTDLKGISLKEGDLFLDAGCGSGILSRYLATAYPQASGIGCDSSDIALAQAKKAARDIPNLTFEKQNLNALDYKENSFDLIVFRYVLQHLGFKTSVNVVQKAIKLLKPSGRVCLIDIDGLFYNIYPRTARLDKALKRIEAKGFVDLRMGRKLASILDRAGIESLDWHIDTVEYKGALLQQEKEMATAKINSAFDYFSKVLGGKKQVEEFKKEFCAALDNPGVVLFYNKFVVVGRK